MSSAFGVNPYYQKVQSPIGDLTNLVGSAQSSHTCRELELNVLDCTDVFGRKGMLRQCKDAYDDFSECIYSTKQIARVHAMRAERMRQYVSGERSKKDLYAEPPKVDGYFKTYGRDID